MDTYGVILTGGDFSILGRVVNLKVGLSGTLGSGNDFFVLFIMEISDKTIVLHI